MNNILNSKNLTLDEDVLGVSAYYKISAAFNWVSPVHISNCTPIANMPAYSQGVAGTLSNFLSFQDVSVRLYLFDVLTQQGPERHALLVFDQPVVDKLTPAAVFSAIAIPQGTEQAPELAAMASITYQQPYLIFSTADYTTTATPALPFPLAADAVIPTAFAQAIKPSITAGFNALLSTQLASSFSLPSHTVSTTKLPTIPLQTILTTIGLQDLCSSPFPCTVQLSESFSAYRLDLSHALNIAASSLPLKPMLTRVGIATYLGFGDIQAPTFTCQGHLTIGKTSDLAIDLNFTPGTASLFVSFIDLPNFADLATLFTDCHLSQLIGEGLPSGILDAIGKLSIDKLSFVIDISSTPSISNIAIELTAENPLQFTTQIGFHPVIRVTIADPFITTNRQTTFEILGICSFPGATLGAQLSHTLASATADASSALLTQLLIGTGVDTSAFINEWLTRSGIHLPAIDFCDLEFVATKNGSAEAISFEIEVLSQWTIKGTNFGFDGVSLEINFQKDNNNTSWQFVNASAMGTLEIGSAYFYVSAQYDYNNHTWSFSSGTTPGQQISLGQWIGAIASELKLPGTRELITELDDLQIEKCFIQYDTSKNSRANFQLALTSSITGSHFLGLPLDKTIVNVQRSGSGTSFSLQATSASQTKLSDFMGSVNTHYGLGVNLPSSITSSSVALTQIFVSYDAVSHCFSFEIDAALSIADLLVDLGLMNATSKDTITSNSSSIGLTFIKNTEGKSTGHSTKLTISFAGGILLDQILDLSGDLPSDFNPQLDRMDISYDMSHIPTNGASATDTALAFSMYFNNPQVKAGAKAGGHPGTSSNCVLKGIHTKSAVNGVTTSAFAGHMYSLDGNALDINFGSSFPIQTAIEDFFIAKISTNKGNNTPQIFTLYGASVTIDTTIDLSALPVVGKFLHEANLSFNALRFTYSNTSIAAEDLAIVNTFLGEIEIAPLVIAQSTIANSNTTAASFPKGFSLQGALSIGDNVVTVPLHTNFAQSNTNQGSVSLNPQTNNAATTPSPVGKKFGPITIASVGLGMRDGGIGIKITGGLAIGPVAFELIGFEITSPIDHFDPDITLEGLGLNINKGGLSLEGLMMKRNIEIPKTDYITGQVTTEQLTGYTGSLSIQYTQYNLDALGSYAQLPDGSPSMFLYGFLGAPLGGPPFLYISGVAAGFGYNRTFNLPPPTAISQFPLIQPVIGTLPQGTMADNFAAMNKDFLPKEGAFWGAVGLRIESFNMIECFALLDIQFNEEIEIDVMGICNMSFPVQQEGESTLPLARVLLGLEARILPEQGILTVGGGIQPGTYFIDPAVHVSGGFGMLSILSDQTSGDYAGAKAGTFTFSIGGYPQHYSTPTYYPVLKRIQLSWQYSSMLSIKGSAYFAIVPEAMLAGGALQSLFQIGGPLDISASFILGADLTINWKPYHYTADVSLEIDVSAKINIDCWLFSIHMDFNMDLGADLQVFGPPFAGKGFLTVHTVITFSVDVSFGEANPTPQPIDWSTFKNSFLPAPANMLTASVSNGLINKVAETTGNITTTIDVVNPKTMSISCQTAFPLKSIIDSTKTSITALGNTNFGIAPMAKTNKDVQSSLTITITKEGEQVEDDFEYTIVNRNLPSAMWQAATKEGELPDTKGKGLLTDLVGGIEITPKVKGPGTAFTVVVPGKEIIKTPGTEKIAAFTYDATHFSMPT